MGPVSNTDGAVPDEPHRLSWWPLAGAAAVALLIGALVIVLNITSSDSRPAAHVIVATAQGKAVTVDLVENPSVAATPPVVVTSEPKHGGAALSASGVLTYTPDPGYSGYDLVGYQLRYHDGASTSFTVRIDVG